MTLYSIGIVAKHYGVSPSTIRRWAEKGLLAVACRTLGDHRRFDLQLNPVATGVERKHLGYAVFLPAVKKKTCFGRQNDSSRPVARKSSPTSAPVLTATRPGLRALLNRILKGHVHTLSVVYEDRLLRFGTALIRLMCRKTGTDMRVLEEASPKTFEEELAKDVVTLMTVFCARLYGKRSHKNKTQSL